MIAQAGEPSQIQNGYPGIQVSGNAIRRAPGYPIAKKRGPTRGLSFNRTTELSSKLEPADISGGGRASDQRASDQASGNPCADVAPKAGGIRLGW